MKKSTLQKRLKSIEEHRSGHVQVSIPFDVGQPMPVKNCLICHKPAPFTSIGRFACRACRLIFS